MSLSSRIVYTPPSTFGWLVAEDRWRRHLPGEPPEPLQALVEAVRASEAPTGVHTRIIAIDGPGGSGKSSLAEWLTPPLDAQVIHTDDFASWEDPVDWWPRLVELALEPLAEGRPA